MNRVITVDHLTRVEGHGGIRVELDADRVTAVELQLYEGLRLVEGLVRGRRFEDIPQIVSRICAICSVAHTLTSIKATEVAFGISPGQQCLQLRDLMYRGENIESHALHLFLLALPDYLGYPSVTAMVTEHRDVVALGLRLKKLGNSIQEVVGGRAVHPVNAIVGGFGRLPNVDQLAQLRSDLLQGLKDCEAALELIGSLPPVDYCRAHTPYVAMRSADQYGYYAGNEIVLLSGEERQTIPCLEYESLIAEEAVPHSHAKRSFHAGKPFMVGALARLAVNRDALTQRAADAMQALSLKLPSENPMDNNKAQAMELALDVDHALHTVNVLLDTNLEPESIARIHPRAARGTAVTEAPRGLLVHSYTYDRDGRVTQANVVTPTAMNAASIEERFRHAIDQSTERDITTLRRKLEMITRAYDPCISCSVHLLR